jgi:beta-lactamase regulating signal transducer with metallopeptidase domain
MHLALLAHFDSFARLAASVTVDGLVQGLALALALALCLGFARRISAAQRFALWMAAYAAVATAPLLPLLLRASNASVPPASTAPHAWLQLDARWTLVLSALWLLASIARATSLMLHIARLRRLWHTATPVGVPAIAGTRRTFEVCATKSLDRPSVIGFFAPRVLIPDWLLPRLTPEELHQIVLHEATHLTRRDDWTNLFQKLCLVLFPLNPALWAIDRQLAKEREMACDEAVVRITKAPRAYAACLASLAERGLAYRKEALSLGAWQCRSELVDRVHRILRAPRSIQPVAARILLGTFGCGLVAGTVELARCPQLVAFVSPHPASAAMHDEAASQLGDTVYPTNPRREMLAPRARILQAKAVMPAPQREKPFTGRAQWKTSAVGELRATSSESGANPRHPSAADTHRRAGSPDAGSAPQLVVLTAWEQIETSAPNAESTADYDVNSTVGPTRGVAANPSPSTDTGIRDAAKAAPARRITVTRLIFRVVPANSKSSQPAAIPLGWFVFQL